MQEKRVRQRKVRLPLWQAEDRSAYVYVWIGEKKAMLLLYTNTHKFNRENELKGESIKKNEGKENQFDKQQDKSIVFVKFKCEETIMIIMKIIIVCILV